MDDRSRKGVVLLVPSGRMIQIFPTWSTTKRRLLASGGSTRATGDTSPNVDDEDDEVLEDEEFDEDSEFDEDDEDADLEDEDDEETWQVVAA